MRKHRIFTLLKGTVIMAKDERMVEEMIPALLSSLNYRTEIPTPEHFAIAPKARKEIEAGLAKRITSITQPTVLWMFLEYMNTEGTLDAYLENPDCREAEESRARFSAAFIETEFEELKARVPSLSRMIFACSDQYQKVINEMIERLDLDYEEISETFFPAPFQAVTGVITNAGDVHNNGHSTMVLSLDQGKLVYKPHDVKIDQSSYDLIRRFFWDIMKAPRVLQREDYGFTEFIVNQPADTDPRARQYFRNLGGFTAVVQMLGSSDLHHTNVLSLGIYPVIVDYEQMICPNPYLQKEGAGRDLRYSLLFSSLMPKRRGNIEMSILFAEDESNISSPKIDGKRRSVLEYPEEFLSGFEEIYRRCMENKEALKRVISSMKGIPVRHIYRATKAYSKSLQTSHQPGWMETPGLKEELFRLLSTAMKRSGIQEADKITEAEVNAILRGDIPYFYSITDSCDLCSEGKVVYPGFFPESSIDHVCSRIDHMGETDLRFEKDLLQKAMTRVLRHITPEIRPTEKISTSKDISNEELIKEAENIFRIILEDAVRTPSGTNCWFGPDYVLETGMHLLGSGLLDGTAGLALFFAALHALSSDEDLKHSAEAEIDAILSRMEKNTDALSELGVIPPNTESCSLSSGLAGKLHACVLIHAYMKDERTCRLLSKLVRLLEKLDLSFETADVYNGLSGLLAVLCRHDVLYEMTGVPRFCSQLADLIKDRASIPFEGKKIWKTLSEDWPISGAGHGQSGVAAALYRAGQRLSRRDLIDASLAGFLFEEQVYNRTLGVWPDRRKQENTEHYLNGYCTGAPGIGRNALLLQYENYRLTLNRAIAAALKEPLLYKDFLCCGNCAGIDFLLDAGRLLNREDLISAARMRMTLLKERADRQGHYNCVNETLSYVFSSNLFYGTAGIGYEMLRMADPETIESVYL